MFAINLVNFCSIFERVFLCYTVVTDRTFGSAQMTELFSAEHRTFFFVLHSMPMASFHIFVLLNDPHVWVVIIGL